MLAAREYEVVKDPNGLRDFMVREPSRQVPADTSNLPIFV